MVRKINTGLLVFIVFLGAFAGDTAAAWDQYRGDAANSGSVLVRTEVPERSHWRIEVLPGLYSGPVIGDGGVIYLGQIGLGLLAVNPDGSVRWLAPLTGIEGGNQILSGNRILSTPAVAADGSIYIILTDYRQRSSTLHKVSPGGTELWVVTLPQPSLSSPTVLGDLVFIAAYAEVSGAIFVVDSDGNRGWTQETSDPCRVTGRSVIGQAFDSVVDFFDHFPPGIEIDSEAQVGPPPPAIQPTITVVDGNTVGGLANPVVILPQYCSVLFYEWTGAGFVRLDHDFYADEPRRSTSAAVDQFGRVVVGSVDGRVRSYRIDPTISPTGTTKEWTTDLNDHPIWMVPAVRPIGDRSEFFVAAGSRIWTLSAAGEVVNTTFLSAAVTTPPVVSADHVFVGTDRGLFTLTWNLDILGKVDGVAPWLYRSPAIGEDGAVVLAESDGLMQFGGSYSVTDVAPEGEALVPEDSTTTMDLLSTPSQWSGTGTQNDPPVDWPITIALNGGSVGEVVGQVTYPSLGCSGDLILLPSDDSTGLRLLEDITVGEDNCLDFGEFVLRRDTNPDRLAFTWTSQDGNVTASGNLSRTDGAVVSTGTGSLEIHVSECPPGFSGGDYFGTCHDNGVANATIIVVGPNGSTWNLITEIQDSPGPGVARVDGLLVGNYEVFQGEGSFEERTYVFCSADQGQTALRQGEIISGDSIRLDILLSQSIVCDFYLL